jgi:hypothetical protein
MLVKTLSPSKKQKGKANMKSFLVALGILAFSLCARLTLAQGVPMGSEFQINEFTTNAQRFPSVASDSSGNLVVVWQSSSQNGIVGRRYASSGAPLAPEFQVNTYTTGAQRFPSVASDSSGNFVVVWDSYQDGSFYGVYGQRYASTGAPVGSEFQVNTYTTNRQRYPRVASDSTGNFVVVWESYLQDGNFRGVFGQRFASTGAPAGAEFQVNTYTTRNQARPSVASDSTGNFVVVWHDDTQDGSNYGVFGQRYASSGAPAGGVFLVNTFTTNEQSFPSVASDPSGNFVVVWQSRTQDGSYYGVFGQRWASSGAKVGPEFRVNTYTTERQRDPTVALDSSGNFVVVWDSLTQDDGVFEGVFGQRYASTGTPLGPEFRVNTYTTEVQRVPRVASDSLGNFVIVWESRTQDGSLEGVFGQRYGMIVPVDLTGFRAE